MLDDDSIYMSPRVILCIMLLAPACLCYVAWKVDTDRQREQERRGLEPERENIRDKEGRIIAIGDLITYPVWKYVIGYALIIFCEWVLVYHMNVIWWSLGIICLIGFIIQFFDWIKTKASP